MLSRLKTALRWLLRRSQAESELDEELRYHVEQQTEQNIRLGMNPEEARHAARRAFGGVEQAKERSRDTRGVRWLEDLWQDLRYSSRMLRKRPAFTLVVVVTLALGIGANTAIFSVIDALMLRRLPVQNPSQLVMVWTRDDSPARSDATFNHVTFVKFRELSQVFSGVAASWEIERSNLIINPRADQGGSAVPEAGQVRVGLVSGDYFSTLGVNTLLGRDLNADDDRVPGGHPVAVLSFNYWERRFARAADAVGRTFTLNGISYDIIGVTPRGFSGEWVGRPVDLWVPFMMCQQVMPETPGFQRYPTRVIARLKPGMTMSQAQAASHLLYQQMLSEEAGSNPTPQRQQEIARQRIELEPAARGYSPQRDSFALPLALLMTAVGLVLLIACANVANLLLARAEARQREIAVRLALGATRGRIMRQLLTESMLLAGLGGALGLLFAVWGTSALASLASAAPVVMYNARNTAGLSLDLQPDARVFAFTAMLCLLTGLLFGLAPAFRAIRAPLSPSFNERSVGGLSRQSRLGKALVIVQVALSLLLLVGAGLCARTLRNLNVEKLGYERQHLLLVWTVPGQTGRQGPANAELWQTVRERLTTLPGVLSAGALNGGMLSGYLATPGNIGTGVPMLVEGQPPKRTNMPGGRSFITPRFFETMGIPLVAGREFTERDTDTAPPVVIINETMARFFFDNQNPVGRFVRWSVNDTEPTEIVGVVKDFVRGTPRGVSQPELFTFFSYRHREALNRGAQSRLRAMMVAVRTAGDPLRMAARIRQELREIDPNLPVLRINTIEEQLSDVLAQDRLTAVLSGFFGVLAVLLASIGLYGVISYTVARRTNEIGIRMALGAQAGDVLRLVIGEGMKLVLMGGVLGLLAALALTRLIKGLLYGVSPTDPLTFAAVALLLLGVALVACYLPARRAAKIDPMVALRAE